LPGREWGNWKTFCELQKRTSLKVQNPRKEKGVPMDHLITSDGKRASWNGGLKEGLLLWGKNGAGRKKDLKDLLRHQKIVYMEPLPEGGNIQKCSNEGKIEKKRDAEVPSTSPSI